MNISKNRLQGFTSGTPAYVILHGLLNLTKGHNFAASFEDIGNPNAAFREAVIRLFENRHNEDAWHYARPISRELYDALEECDSVGEAHMLIHRHLERQSFTEAHVNTCTAARLVKIDRHTRHLLSLVLPEDKEGDLLIITARSPDGRMVLMVN